MAKRYSEELKQIMIGKYEGGTTVKAICSEYGVSRSTLLLWVKQYSPDNSGQTPREQYLMRKELERLRIEKLRIRQKKSITNLIPRNQPHNEKCLQFLTVRKGLSKKL